MPRCGGHSPAPRRCGGGVPLTESIVRSLEAQMGDAYTRDPNSVFHARNMAVARIIASMWSAAARVRRAFDPVRSTVKDRLASICRVPMGELEEFFAQRLRRLGPTLLADVAYGVMGSSFVGIEYVPKASWALSPPYKSSGAAIVLIRLATTTFDGAFYDGIKKLAPKTIASLPAWQMPIWYVPSTSATGSPAAGFYLDEDHNLDHQIFD